MRLTLRTMLAWLDDALDPTDAHEIGKKIEESEFASKLVQRVRVVTRKAQLGAPKFEGRGAHDANTVSEYLDGSLAPDRTPGFEKLCLESDAQLAEVASCLQILTLVLGDPADTPPPLRERVYALGNAVKGASDSPLGGGPAAAVGAAADAVATNGGPGPADEVTDDAAGAQPKRAASLPEPAPLTSHPSSGKGELTASQLESELDGGHHEPKTPRAKPEVPDYLRVSKKWNLWPYLATTAMVFLIVFAGLAAMGPLNSNHPLWRMLSGDAVAQADPAAGPAQDADKNLPPGPGQDPAVPPASPVAPAGPAAPITAPAVPAVAPVTPGGSATPVTPAPGGLKQPEIDPSPAPAPTSTPIPPTPGDAVPAAELPGNALGAAPTEGAGAKPPTTVAAVTPDEFALPGDAPKPEPRPVIVAGKLISAEQILAVSETPKEGEARLWSRVPMDGPVMTNSEIIALPGFRPVLELPGLEMQLVGPTRTMLYSRPDSTLVLDFINGGSGRLTLTSPKGPAKIGVDLFEHRGVLHLMEPGSEAAVSVERVRLPGVDPQVGPIHIAARISCISGRLQWEEGGKLTPLPKDFSLSLFNAVADIEDSPTPPAWTDLRNDDPSERRAAKTLEPLVGTEKNLVLSLVENSASAPMEVASLSTRALCEVDFYEPFVKSLSDKMMRSYWDDHYDAVQRALARNLDASDELWLTLSRVTPKVSGPLYELLVRYAPESLEGGGAAKLISLLESDSMEVRVLASENLRRITGWSLGYRPDADVRTNRLALQRWNEKLSKREVAYHADGVPIPIGDDPAADPTAAGPDGAGPANTGPKPPGPAVDNPANQPAAVGGPPVPGGAAVPGAPGGAAAPAGPAGGAAPGVDRPKPPAPAAPLPAGAGTPPESFTPRVFPRP
ncbi:hypothetical protein [Lignipirellula cremea]|uniref:Uncharacterized protein n=1 Tax=Lignipirellula cremea TaxID=2528010 RepID=A0A518DZG8_9BACT|nr:hypothetical protein [Lignipirellula cremea]QDU97222.1 hypothetical protein Pla8534_50670 [Lignipirellula cremea]